MPVVAVIPVKSFQFGKQRLSSELSDQRRREIGAALAEHTVTVAGNEAHFRSAGGINDTGRQVRPGVFATDFSLANVRLDVVADLSQPTKTLTVTEKNAGCRWSGETR